jgi:hypothetical protein
VGVLQGPKLKYRVGLLEVKTEIPVVVNLTVVKLDILHPEVFPSTV